MPAPESRSSGAPPVLASFLLGGGLACAAAGLWLRGGDVTGWVERKIAGARGSMSAETAAWLQDNPPSSLLLLAGLALAGLGGLYLFLRSRLQPGLARLSAGTNAKWDCAVAGLVVIAWYFPTLPSGYFRYDDFELLTVARESGFRATLWQPHGDHVLPLTRVLAWAGLTFFGTSAWPYNLWLWLSMVGVVIAGMLLLTEMKVSRPARWIFAGLVIFWNPWAEMMTGYYILSTYLLIAVLGLAAAWCYLRWRRSGGTHWAAALAGCVLLAPLVDVSGAYVIGLAGVFLARDLADRPGANGFRAWLHEHRRVLGGLALATTISGACLLHAYRVVNPGVFLGMAGGEQRTLFQLARDLGYLLGAGTLLSMATPFVYARLPAALLGALTAAVCLPALFYFGAAWRAADRSRRLLLGAIFLVVLGAGLMVALGRAPTDTWIVRWAAKHLCPVYVWLCLLIAAAWDTLQMKLRAPRRLIFAEFTAVLLVGFVLAQTAFGRLGMAVAFPPFGYPAEIRDAERRRAAVANLRDGVAGTLATRLENPAVVPVLDGNFLQARHPSLFRYNLSHYGPFLHDRAAALDFVRNPAMQTWHSATVRTVPVLRDALRPEVARLLAGDPVLRSYYFAEVPLEARLVPATAAGSMIHRSEGGTAALLQAEPWDPETRPLLQVAIEDAPSAEGGTLTVIFRSSLLQADWHGTVALPREPGQVIEVDLRQVYAFALSPRVSQLRVIPPPSGRYSFRLAEAAP